MQVTGMSRHIVPGKKQNSLGVNKSGSPVGVLPGGAQIGAQQAT